MSQPVAIALFILAVVVTIDIVIVRRRAAAEATALHVALAVMTQHLQALVTTADALEILQSVPGWLVARDLGGRITFITSAAAKMMNATPAELLGSTPESLKNFQSGTKTLSDFAYLVQVSGRPQPNIEINYDPPGGGSRLRLLCSVAPLRDLETGGVVGTVTILTMIDNYISRW